VTIEEAASAKIQQSASVASKLSPSIVTNSAMTAELPTRSPAALFAVVRAGAGHEALRTCLGPGPEARGRRSGQLGAGRRLPDPLSPILAQAAFGSRIKGSAEKVQATNVLTYVRKLAKLAADGRFENPRIRVLDRGRTHSCDNGKAVALPWEASGAVRGGLPARLLYFAAVSASEGIGLPQSMDLCDPWLRGCCSARLLRDGYGSMGWRLASRPCCIANSAAAGRVLTPI
jgi:hypothetical protein